MAGICNSCWLTSTSLSELSTSPHPVFTDHRPPTTGHRPEEALCSLQVGKCGRGEGALGSVYLSYSQTHQSDSLLCLWGGQEPGLATLHPPIWRGRLFPLPLWKNVHECVFVFDTLICSLDTILDSLKKSWSKFLYKQKVVEVCAASSESRSLAVE